MGSTELESGSPEFAELRATIATMAAQLDELRAQPSDGGRSRRSWRRRLGVLGAVACVGCLVAGVAAAQTGSTTDVHFVALSTPYKLLTGTSIAANKTDSPVVIGGVTTVPADATTVELDVTASGTAAGDLNFYPAGNVGGGSGQFLSWAAHGSDTGTVQENVGTKDELTFYNVSGAAAKVTATIVGYSTQVTAGDVSGLDGSAGQVLTDTGGGAAWQAPSGGAAYVAGPIGPVQTLGNNYVALSTLTVPPGDYTISGTLTLSGGGDEGVQCVIAPPTDTENSVAQIIASVDTGLSEVPTALQGWFTASHTVTLSLLCEDPGGGAFSKLGYMTAIQQSSINPAYGTVTNY